MPKPFNIVIISYNRPDDLLALLKNLSALKQKEFFLEEVIVINNCSTASYAIVEAYLNEAELPVKYVVAPQNLGVSRGRNFALQFSTADYLIFLDDDVEFLNADALFKLETFFKQPSPDGRPVGVVSLKVFYYDTGDFQKTAFPHKDFNKYKNESFFYTYYYPGCAHTISKKVIEDAGILPENFFYGMEEYDLSYRVIDKGYCLVYTDSITVLHKESPLGRKQKSETLQMMWVNKCIVAWKYLPKKYFYTTAFLWSLFYLKRTGGNVRGMIKGFKKVTQIPATQKRQPLSTASLQYLKNVEARLWY